MAASCRFVARLVLPVDMGQGILVGSDGNPASPRPESIMAKRIPSFDHLHFHVRPDDAGQIVEISYAYDAEAQRVVRRIYDQSDRSDSFATAEDDRPTFEPYNNQRYAHLDWEPAYTGPTLAERLLDGDDDLSSATFSRLNDEGEGFDPAEEISEWKLVWLAGSTDGVAVYRDGDDAVLVGTDGSGDDDSRWAVRVSA